MTKENKGNRTNHYDIFIAGEILGTLLSLIDVDYMVENKIELIGCSD